MAQTPCRQRCTLLPATQPPDSEPWDAAKAVRGREASRWRMHSLSVRAGLKASLVPPAMKSDNRGLTVTASQYLWVDRNARRSDGQVVGIGPFFRYGITPKDRNLLDQFYSFGNGGIGGHSDATMTTGGSAGRARISPATSGAPPVSWVSRSTASSMPSRAFTTLQSRPRSERLSTCNT